MQAKNENIQCQYAYDTENTRISTTEDGRTTEYPEWWSIDPDSTDVFYRTQDEVNKIRRKAGESGGHHPHGLALGGPEGQNLTITNETRTLKNIIHNKVSGLQRRVINAIKKQLNQEEILRC